MTKTEILLRQRTRRQKRGKRNKMLLLSICGILLIGGLYMKTHNVKTCEIISTKDNIVRVQHPDTNHQYDVIVNDIENYKYEEYAKVTFDELHDWEKYFTIKGIKPCNK